MEKFYLLRTARCLVLFLLIAGYQLSYSQCDPVTPSFTLDLTGAPNASSVTPNASRNGTCCNGSVPCVKIVVLLNVNAMALQLTPTGADPGGALTYEFNCNGQQIPGGTPICLPSGVPSVTLTICKVGNNANQYSVTSIPRPYIPDSVFVRNGCTQTLVATGYSVPTITWGAINGGANTTLFNSYLSCTAGCATVIVSPSGTVPVAFVDYTVGGLGVAPCQTNYYMDTVRVYFYNNLIAPLSPTTICFGSVSAVLSPTPSGGKPSYTYSWSTGSTAPSVTVGAGNYTLTLGDQTGCPPITSTVTVTNFTVPISANAGPDRVVCKTSPAVALSGTIQAASGGIWSGGAGVFTPTNTALNVTYTPTPGEVTNGLVQLYLTSTGNSGCPPGKDTVNITFQEQPVIVAISDRTVCANNAITNLTSTLTMFAANVIWTSNGTGTFSPTNSVNTTYTPSTADINSGTVTAIITTTNNGSCNVARDTVKIIITPRPIVNAGANQTICSVFSAPLSGTVTGATTTGTWSSAGDGVFAPNNSALNGSYTPGPLDINTGSVTIFLTSTGNGNCLSVKDTLQIFIRKQATVNAGPNLLLCSNVAGIPLSGTVTGATTTGNWSSGGTGTFNSATSILTNTYSHSPADISAGTIVFSLTSTNNGPCPAVLDTVMMRVKTIASLTAGPNHIVCSSQNSINLSGNVFTSPPTASWSASGTGSFLTNLLNLSGSYSLSPGDIALGQVTFTLRSINNGVCPAVSDTVKVSITQQATVNAGPNLVSCSSPNLFTLNGLITGGTNNGTWFHNGTGNLSSASSLSTSYVFSPGDISNGIVSFTLQSVNNGTCPPHSDTVSVRIITMPSANAGSIAALCASQNTVSLTGAITGAAGTGSWSTSGNGLIANPTSLSTSYSLTSADITAGLVTFTLVSTGNGPCPAGVDSVSARIIVPSIVNAGFNQSICSNVNQVSLSGTVTGNGGGGQWVSSGPGSYNPGDLFLTTAYNMTAADITNGFVTFTLNSTNNGPCPVIQDTVKVLITTFATVNSGNNQIICSHTNSVVLSGTVAGASSTGTWTASGSGSFTPSNGALQNAYLITPADITSGFVNFSLTSTNNKGCPAVTDSVRINIQKRATVNAGPDFTVCSTQPTFLMAGNINGITSTGLWSTTGTGSFSPNNTSLGGTYNFTAGDITKGNLKFALESTSNGICPAVRDSMTLRIIRYPTITMQVDTTICQNQLPFNVRGSVFGGSGGISWTTSGTGSFVPNSFTNPTSYVFGAGDLVLGNIGISLISINNGPCGDVKSTLTINILPTPVAAFSASSYTIELPSPPVSFNNESKGGKNYKWTFGEGPNSTVFNPTHSYNTVGFYTVTLVTINQYGCSDTTERTITVTSDVRFPNAFTPSTSGPNGGTYNKNDYATNLNDVFYPYTGGVIEYKMVIFNRWGELLFESNDLSIGWDGYFNGKLCQQDAYIWKADIKFFDGRSFNKTGNVTLLR